MVRSGKVVGRERGKRKAGEGGSRRSNQTCRQYGNKAQKEELGMDCTLTYYTHRQQRVDEAAALGHD